MKDQNQPDVNEPKSFSPFKYLLIGGAMGALLALMFAPKPGRHLRADIADATRKGIDRSRESMGLGRARTREDFYIGRRAYFRYRTDDRRTHAAANAQGSLPGSDDFEEPEGDEQYD